MIVRFRIAGRLQPRLWQGCVIDVIFLLPRAEMKEQAQAIETTGRKVNAAGNTQNFKLERSGSGSSSRAELAIPSHLAEV